MSLSACELLITSDASCPWLMHKTNGFFVGYREGVVKKAAPTGVAEGGVNHNEALCAAFRALAEIHDAKGQSCSATYTECTTRFVCVTSQYSTV